MRLAAAGSLVAVLAAWGAHAQEADGLRGAVSEDAVTAAAPAAPEAAVQGSEASTLDDMADGEPDGIISDPLSGRLGTASALQPAASVAAASTSSASAGSAEGESGAAANARLARQTTERDDEEAGERAQHALAIEALPRTDALADDPFGALGVRAGGFILRPSVETGITASSNAARTPTGSSGVLAETTLRLNAQSDWAEHSATLDGFGTFRRSLSGDDDVRDVEGGINAALRFDLGHEWQARTGLSYAVRPESASAPDAVLDATEQPLRQQLRAEAGLDKALGKLRLSGTASVEHDWYGDAELADGGTLDQSKRDSTLGLVTLRTGYAVSPALTPFVEAELGRRIYDETGDTDRSALRLGARAGLSLDLHEKISGEFAAGWLRESFRDDALAPIQGPSLLASLRWSPVRETFVTLNAATTVEGTTTEGESGSLIQDLRLEVERTLRANLSAQAALGVSLRDYTGSDGRDTTLVGEVGATWWLNRWVGLSGRLRHERLESNLPGREYRENSAFVGTRLQY